MNANIIIKLNKHFKPVKHPFNMQSRGEKSYAEWEFERGGETVKMYTDSCICGSDKLLFKDKTVLDIGAGAGGKSLYYLTRGARKVTSVDVIPQYKAQAEEYAKKLGLYEKFEYTVADARYLPYPDNTFDLVIMNDAMEHVDPPEQVIAEVRRVLKKGGRLLVNFPPYGHPFGAHLSDVIFIPWVHLFFDDTALIDAYKKLTCDLPDAKARQSFRISKGHDGSEYFSYINKLTIKRFNRIIEESQMKRVYYRELPLRKYLLLLAKMPLLKEWFVRTVVCIMEK